MTPGEAVALRELGARAYAGGRAPRGALDEAVRLRPTRRLASAAADVRRRRHRGRRRRRSCRSSTGEPGASRWRWAGAERGVSGASPRHLESELSRRRPGRENRRMRSLLAHPSYREGISVRGAPRARRPRSRHLLRRAGRAGHGSGRADRHVGDRLRRLRPVRGAGGARRRRWAARGGGGRGPAQRPLPADGHRPRALAAAAGRGGAR